MIKRHAFLCLTILLFWIPAAQAQDSEMIMSKVRAKYKNINDFKADLSIISCDAASGTCHRFEGKIEIKKPNKIRMDIKKPGTQQIICDGKNVWLYMDKDKQVVRSNIDQTKDFLILLNPLDKLLNGKIINNCKTNGEHQCWLNIPEFKDFLKEIKILVNKETYEITGIDVVDVNDNSSEYHFSNIKINAGLKDNRFKFIIPKQAKLIENN